MKRSLKESDAIHNAKVSRKIKKLCILQNEDELEELNTEINQTNEISESDISENSDEEENEHIDSDDDDNTCGLKINKNLMNIMKQVPDIPNNCDNIEELSEKQKENLDKLKTYMSNFKKGMKMKKINRVLPQLNGWHIYLDKADYFSWTPLAVSETTKIFYHNGGANNSIYYEKYFLKFLRNDIEKNHRLCDVLYQTLKGCAYRRMDFVTNLMCPWFRDITTIEADVLVNALKQISIKSIDKNVNPLELALCNLLNFEYSKGRLLIIQCIFDKRNTLTVPTINAIVEYFYKLVENFEWFQKNHFVNKLMPLKWFQTIHVFLNKFRHCLTLEQIKKLKEVNKIQAHDKYSPLIEEFLQISEKKLSNS